eukprot:1548402-Rhodomonas_salina.3
MATQQPPGSGRACSANLAARIQVLFLRSWNDRPLVETTPADKEGHWPLHDAEQAPGRRGRPTSRTAQQTPPQGIAFLVALSQGGRLDLSSSFFSVTRIQKLSKFKSLVTVKVYLRVSDVRRLFEEARRLLRDEGGRCLTE